MAKLQSAERVSREVSDNFVFQRSLLAYHHASQLIEGDVLEIGTGTGYGVEVLAPSAARYVTVDKYRSETLKSVANVEYLTMKVPPLKFDNAQFDYVVSFQVIEHIKDDVAFVRETARVLRPGGQLILTTPNAPMSLTRNPWHVREYNSDALYNLLSCSFSKVEVYGVFGNERVMEYYSKNRDSVRRIMRFDVLDLQHRLPKWVLQGPYDVMNRLNRRRLLKKNRNLTESITMDDYAIRPYAEGCFDLLVVATK